MKVLVTNDDGIDAPGLKALTTALSVHADISFTVVAPDRERSACSHSMSLHGPVGLEQRSESHFAHTGTVADGVYLGINQVLQQKPDIVIAGINAGANLAEDVIYSGTVAGAREAVLRGVPGLAVSLCRGTDFSAVAPSVVQVARTIIAEGGSPQLFNLNFPAGMFTGPELAPLGHRPYQQKVTPATQDNFYLLGGPVIPDAKFPKGSDVALDAAGIASLTPLCINQTDQNALDRFKQRIKKL